ncbi:MAG: outer membrane beta-barrel protein [Ignavibacteria bacterium]|nr:outer membrane beta-barrel protein [Ignavibacteria bacterium]
MNKTYFYRTFFIIFLSISFISVSFAGDPYNRVNSKEIKLLDKEAGKLVKKRNSLFSLDADIKFGVGISNTHFELNKPDTTGQLTTTSSKVGPTIAATLSLNFFGFGFTTGFAYGNKGFESSNGNKNNLNYFNIPLLIYFDFNVGEKVRVEGNLGPYFGLLTSQDQNTLYKAKNFDFGVTGELQFAYMFNNYMGVLLGGNYEYGGLNNLSNNELVKRMNTSTINIYTGLKFEL